MILKRDIFFDPAGKYRRLHIYLPEGYCSCEERYPVMYFFDGHNLFSDSDATYGKSWGLKDFLDRWEKPVIIVGMECSHEGRTRLDEYCPYDIDAGYLGHLSGYGDKTARWIAETLKPMIDAEFRTYSFREATGIGGSSMGGLMSLYTVMKHNGIFSKAACLSPTVTVCEDLLMRDMAAASLDGDTRIYMSWGEHEGGTARYGAAASNRRLQAALDERGLITRLYFQKDGNHCEADWEKQVPGFMDFLWLAR